MHYDLKPGNILFHNGYVWPIITVSAKFASNRLIFVDPSQVKIADFGLAKLLDENDGDQIELTSPGYGT